LAKFLKISKVFSQIFKILLGMLPGNKLRLVFSIEANSSCAAGGTGIEIANNCFQEKSETLAYLLLSLFKKGTHFLESW